MYQLVHSDYLQTHDDGLIYFRKQLFSGVLYQELQEIAPYGWFEDRPISLTCIQKGKRIGQYIPPLFPKELFDMQNLQYMWIANTENGEYGFPDDFNHSNFTGVLFQGNSASIPMPPFPNIQNIEWEEELKKWNEEYKIKESIDYPLTLDDLQGGGGRFYAVINGEDMKDNKIIYQIDNFGINYLNYIVNDTTIKTLKNSDLFDINNHI
ncbi:hypothetical protein [Acinetobacter sp. P8-3-8]|uniref:hypothetical protein n=1 Tax=Acinetobacter sp. P8-3-8 TaxID=1029823 RepID=UPI0002FFB38B|nr:hypothetical protein [Acinetobacter sp. P8-3-8]